MKQQIKVLALILIAGLISSHVFGMQQQPQQRPVTPNQPIPQQTTPPSVTPGHKAEKEGRNGQ